MFQSVRLRQSGRWAWYASFRVLIPGLLCEWDSNPLSSEPCLNPEPLVLEQASIPQKAATARQAVRQLLHSFRRLGDVLVGVLAPREHYTLAAALVQRVAQSINGSYPGIKFRLAQSSSVAHLKGI